MKDYAIEPAAYTPNQVDAAQTIWAYIDNARSTIYLKNGSTVERARYEKWTEICGNVGSAELRTVAARLGVYFEDIWQAYQADADNDDRGDARDFHKSGASWYYEGVPFLMEQAVTFKDRRGYWPHLLTVEEAVALMEVEFLPPI